MSKEEFSMADRICMCKHKEEDHEYKSDDGWSRDGGGSYGKCKKSDCKCLHYTFNHGKWMYDRGYEDAKNGKEPQL